VTRYAFRRVGVVVLSAASVAGIAGCGVQSQSSAQGIDSGDVPFGLLRPSDNVPSPTTTPGTPMSIIYFVDGDVVVPVERATDQPGRPAVVLRQLLSGATAAEVAQGARSLLPPDLQLSTVVVTDGIATIDLAGSFGKDTDVRARRLAVAQIVFTATELADIRGVRLLLDGKAVDVPNAAGELTQGVLRRSDFTDVVTGA
jgi:spore germination protein GerM